MARPAPISRDVRHAVPADARMITDTLIDAFATDPVQLWIFGTEARCRRYGRAFFAMHARRLTARGLAWHTDGGASVWAPEGQWRESPADTARVVGRGFVGALPHPIRALRGLLSLEHHHPREPHVYLAAIGVRPGSQGQGLGSALLKPGLAYADARGLPCYLESSNERNVPLYERHGFEVRALHHMPGGGPPMWLMWRP